MLYIVWQDGRLRRTRGNDVAFLTSMDGGASWSGLRFINPDPGDDAHDFNTPTIAAYGWVVYVTWQTMTKGHRISLRYVASTEGGVTFARQRRIGRAGDALFAAHGGTFVGHYMGLDDVGGVHPTSGAVASRRKNTPFVRVSSEVAMDVRVRANSCTIAVAALVLSTGLAGAACTSSRCSDTQAVASFRSILAAECNCTSTSSPKRYRRCVKSHIKYAVKAGDLSPACKTPILRCETDSTCGLPTAIACCRMSKRGHVKARIVKSAPDCRGTACPSARSARDACTSEAQCLSDYDGARAGDSRNVAGIELAWCPAGSFIMGSPDDEPERRADERQVEVTLTRGFWMAKYETTQGDFKRVMGTLPGDLTAQLPEGDRNPVGNVNFAEAESYAAALTQRAHDVGELPVDWEFRLPTEAQWEYAARAGTTTATAFGNSLTSNQANFAGRSYNTAEQGPSLGHAVAVGSYPPSAWGIYDMHGNTFEWCRDWYREALPGGIDPDLHDAINAATPNPDGSLSRVRRGGSWGDDGWACRTAFRLRFEPDRRFDHIGFRVAVVRP